MELPDDILETARRIVETTHPSEYDIAFAILAERERCAKIAEDAGKPYAVHTATGAMMFRAAVEKIAAAIRSQP